MVFEKLAKPWWCPVSILNWMFICSVALALHLGRLELCVLWVVVLIITGL